MPYAIVKLNPLEVITTFATLPPEFRVGRQRIISPVAVGDEGLGYRFVNLIKVGFSQPGTYFTQAGPDQISLNGNDLTVTRTWTAWTQQQIDAYETERKDDIVSRLTISEDILRLILSILVDELNLHSTKFQQVLDATAAATSLADFKTRMGQISAVPQRTEAQLRTAIRNKLNV